MKILESNPEIGFMSCEAFWVDEVGKAFKTITVAKVPDHGVLPEVLYTDFMISNSSVVIRREVINKIGMRDENPKIGVAEEREYELRMAIAGIKFYVIHEPLFKYRFHKNNISELSIAQRLQYLETDYKYISYYKKYNLDYMIWRRFAKESLRMDDINNGKKYCKLALSQKKDPETILIYFLLFFGKYGKIILNKIAILKNNLLYFLGKMPLREKNRFNTYLKSIDKSYINNYPKSKRY